MTMTGCSTAPHTFILTLPAQHCGGIAIRVNVPSGRVLASSDDPISLQFDETGSLSLRDDPFRVPHRLLVRTTDGTTIPLADEVSSEVRAQPPGYLCWPLGRRDDNTIWFFIGTEGEKKDFANRPLHLWKESFHPCR
jgi:hypothetical protein